MNWLLTWQMMWLVCLRGGWRGWSCLAWQRWRGWWRGKANYFTSNPFFCTAIAESPFVICWWRGVTAAVSIGLKDQLWWLQLVLLLLEGAISGGWSWGWRQRSTMETTTGCGSVGFLWREVVAARGPTRRWRGEDELVDEPPPTKIYCCWCGRPVAAAIAVCVGWWRWRGLRLL